MNPKARTNRRTVGHVKPLSIVSRQTKSYPSIAPYVIALSQTDTVEQARWMHALDTRTDGADGRSSNTKPNDSVASYVVALSQTDTIEGARWMHALDVRTEDVHRRPRSSFRLLSNGRLGGRGYRYHGTLVKHVRNRPSGILSEPDRVLLPAGHYKAAVTAQKYGTIVVPVAILAGETTAIHLDSNEFAPTGAPNAKVVRLPDGRVVGWARGTPRRAPGEEMNAPPRGFQPDAVAGPRVVAFRRDARATARQPMPPRPAIVIRLADRRRTRNDATPTILFSSTAAFLEEWADRVLPRGYLPRLLEQQLAAPDLGLVDGRGQHEEAGRYGEEPGSADHQPGRRPNTW